MKVSLERWGPPAVVVFAILAALLYHSSESPHPLPHGSHHWQTVPDTLYLKHDVWVCDATGRMDDAEVEYDGKSWSVYVRGTSYGDFLTEEQAKNQGEIWFNSDKYRTCP